jgi:hypothetical protein
MTHGEYITWAEQMDAQGKTDPMGYPWTSWLLAVHRPDCTVLRDANQRQVYQTQAEFKRSQVVMPTPSIQTLQVGKTMDLFA